MWLEDINNFLYVKYQFFDINILLLIYTCTSTPVRGVYTLFSL